MASTEVFHCCFFFKNNIEYCFYVSNREKMRLRSMTIAANGSVFPLFYFAQKLAVFVFLLLIK